MEMMSVCDKCIGCDGPLVPCDCHDGCIGMKCAAACWDDTERDTRITEQDLQMARALMGAAVARLADLAVVTSDNPRTEEPRAIIDQILPALAAPKGSR